MSILQAPMLKVKDYTVDDWSAMWSRRFDQAALDISGRVPERIRCNASFAGTEMSTILRLCGVHLPALMKIHVHA
jgi:hypothetical protein